jgi:hypothetical protein
VKQFIILLGVLLCLVAPLQSAKAEEFYSTDDILKDIIFPAIDQKVVKSYGHNEKSDWKWDGILSIHYNQDHSYDVAVRIDVGTEYEEKDLVRLRISPSCDSEKLNKEVCNHEFGIKILEYRHLSK